MQLMHEDVQPAGQPQCPSTDTYERTADLLSRLRQKFHEELEPEDAHAHPYGR